MPDVTQQPNDDSNAAFVSLLKELRLRAGLSQEALANEVTTLGGRMSVAMVGMMEIGRRLPSALTLKYLADALSCSSDERDALFRAARHEPGSGPTTSERLDAVERRLAGIDSQLETVLRDLEALSQQVGQRPRAKR